jgi:NAD(P)H dehydrogenase (quinone)
MMRIAVTGARGRLGGHVVRLLAARPACQVVALSRREPPAGPQPGNVSEVRAHYDDPASLRAALRAVDRLVFISSDGDAAQVIVHHHNVVQAAAASGVTHIIALSGLDADLSSPFCYAVTNGHTEQLLQDSGCAVSIARASLFTEFFLGFLAPARATGQIRLPAGQGRISLVSRTDVARCLAALATAPTGRSHDITGPESLTLAAIATLAGKTWGVPIRYVSLTPAAHRAEMARAGEQLWWQYAYSTMFDSIRQQRWSPVSDQVLHLTGRSPAAVREVLAQHSDP